MLQEHKNGVLGFLVSTLLADYHQFIDETRYLGGYQPAQPCLLLSRTRLASCILAKNYSLIGSSSVGVLRHHLAKNSKSTAEKT